MKTRFVLAALAILISSLCFAADAGKRNVLFLVSDDLNCDLHCYGHPQVQSPNLDRLAARGVRFEHAYCQYPLCSPSRSSFLTGRRPNNTKILSNPGAGRFSTDYRGTPHFREHIPDTVTLPQLFKENGYQAARVGKLYHYGVPGQIGTSGLDDLASWNFMVNPAGRDKAEENKIFTFTPGTYGGTLSWLSAEGTDLEQTDGLGATAAISLLEQYKENPFFLAVGFYRPHTPYVAPKKYFDLYPQSSIKLPELSADDKSRTPEAAYQSTKKEQETMTDAQRREAMQAYYASISFMDAQVGRVIDALERLGLADNTIIVFTSDHGYHMYQHGLWQKMSLFENSARVPLLICAPGARATARRRSRWPSWSIFIRRWPICAACPRRTTSTARASGRCSMIRRNRSRTRPSRSFAAAMLFTATAFARRAGVTRSGTTARRASSSTTCRPMPAKRRTSPAIAQHASTVAELRQRLREYAANTPK